MEYFVQDDGRGTIRTLSVNGASAVTYVQRELAEHPILGEPVVALSEAVSKAMSDLEGRRADLSETGFAKLVRSTITRDIAPRFQAAVAAVPAARTDLANRRAPFERMELSETTTPAIQTAWLELARSMHLGDLMAEVESNYDFAVTLLAAGPLLSGIPEAVIPDLKRIIMLRNVERVLSGQRSYLTPPTSADPVAGQADSKAARDEAERFLKAWDTEHELIESVSGGFLASTVHQISLVMAQPADTALRALNGQLEEA